MLPTGLLISVLGTAFALTAPTGVHAEGTHGHRTWQGFDGVVEAYDQVRAALVADHHKAASKKARALQRMAAAQTGRKIRHTAALAAGANQLAKADANDPTALRRSFGEVSKALIGLVKAHLALEAGLHIFECPMAKPFGRWIQRSSKLGNPYMGAAMPACGAASR